jgi:hypothetical protein
MVIVYLYTSRDCRFIARITLKLRTRWSWVISFTSVAALIPAKEPRYSLNGRVDRRQSWSGKRLLHLPVNELRTSSPQSVHYSDQNILFNTWARLHRISAYLLTYLLTSLLTLWSKVLLEKLTGFQLVKKFSSFYGTRRFITAFTSTRHLSLSWASSNQSMSPIPLPEEPS